MKLENIYPASMLEMQKERYADIKNEFTARFCGEPEFFSASGRSEIIGNHTDHNRGAVMAAGINLDAIAAARASDTSIVHIWDKGYGKELVVDISSLDVKEDETGTTYALIRGTAARMAARGYKIGGLNAAITSNVFKGSGLSSSAAIEILIFTLFNHLYNGGELSLVEGAKIAREAENIYFGKPCGLMDQVACALGQLAAIDFCDTAQPKIESIGLDFASAGYSLVITDVHADHADLTDEYAAITREMREVAEFFGADCLRNVDEKEFYASILELRKKVSDRAVLRAIHFFDENRRAILAADFARAGDVAAFLSLINASGMSSELNLQNAYPAGSTAQAMTLALSLARKFLSGKGACRVHGGGFGGTILAFVPCEMTNRYIEKMDAVFGNGSCTELSVRPTGACKVTI